MHNEYMGARPHTKKSLPPVLWNFARRSGTKGVSFHPTIPTLPLRILAYLLPLVLLLGCQKFTVEKLPDSRIHFGNAGGYTGEIREYILLLDNGRILFNNRTSGELEKIGKLKKEELMVFRTEIDKINFKATPNKPANMNTMMTRYSGGLAQPLQWSGPQSAPSKEAGDCFQALMAKVRALREEMQ